MFNALDHVKYDSLQLNKTTEKSKATKFHVHTLVDLAYMELLWYTELLQNSIDILPKHLVPKLLQNAIISRSDAVTTIIANWPFQTLRFADIMSGCKETEEDVFSRHYFNIYRGLATRTRSCKLTCLDCRGITLNAPYNKWIIQMWPLLSLKKSQLRTKKLAKLIAHSAGVDQIELKHKITPKILEERLKHHFFKHTTTSVNLPRGVRLEVKIDSASFSPTDIFYMDYMITNCLRNVTPVYVTVSSIYIKSALLDWNSESDSMAPFIVLKGQDPQVQEGISVQQVEEGVLSTIAGDLERFTNLRSLDIQDCNLYLQEGITRSRTAARTKLCKTFQAFKYLRRLDISFNYLTGCLGELLDALHLPLEFLSLRGCDLNETDLINLSKSKHAASLRELNISKVCQLSVFDNDRISPSCPLMIMNNFPRMTVLNLSQNNLPDSRMPEFGETLQKSMKCLKGLDISGNLMRFESQVELAKCCAQLPSMQWIRLTCTNTSLNQAALADNNQVWEMVAKLVHTMKSYGRDDIRVDVVTLSFAILVDLIDFFE